MYVHRIITIPTLLTLTRLGLIPWLVILLRAQQWYQALIIFAIAAVTDALDGIIARLWNQQSFVGACLDAIADKILIVACYATLTTVPALQHNGVMPGWVVALILCKELVLIIGVTILFCRGMLRTVTAHWLGKTAMALQVSYFMMFLLSAVMNWHSLYLSYLLVGVVLVTLAALVHYSLIGLYAYYLPVYNNRK
jgi:cardiolipin synthase